MKKFFAILCKKSFRNFTKKKMELCWMNKLVTSLVEERPNPRKGFAMPPDRSKVGAPPCSIDRRKPSRKFNK